MRASLPVRAARTLRDVIALLAYLRRRRSLWVAVLVVVLFMLVGSLAVVKTAAISPWVYALF